MVRDELEGGGGATASGASPYPGRRLRVSVVGAGAASPEEADMAEALGRALGKAGAVVITGGLGGVMEAASRGCVKEGGLTVGILPGGEAGSANPWVRIPLATGMGEARNALVVRAGEAVVAVGGGWGTLSEIALARKIGRAVALLGTPPGHLPLPPMASPEEAAEWALGQARAARCGESHGEPGVGIPWVS